MNTLYSKNEKQTQTKQEIAPMDELILKTHTVCHRNIVIVSSSHGLCQKFPAGNHLCCLLQILFFWHTSYSVLF